MMLQLAVGGCALLGLLASRTRGQLQEARRQLSHTATQHASPSDTLSPASNASPHTHRTHSNQRATVGIALPCALASSSALLTLLAAPGASTREKLLAASASLLGAACALLGFVAFRPVRTPEDHLLSPALGVDMHRWRAHALGAAEPPPEHTDQRPQQPPALVQPGLSSSDVARLSLRFSGSWKKDKSRSSDMDKPTRHMRLSFLFRKAINLISRAESSLSDTTFTFKLGSEIPWFKLNESMRTDGGVSSCTRRDFRNGSTDAKLFVDGDNLIVLLWWDEPFGGHEKDVFTLEDDDQRMNVDCSVEMTNGESFQYTLSWIRAS